MIYVLSKEGSTKIAIAITSYPQLRNPYPFRRQISFEVETQKTPIGETP